MEQMSVAADEEEQAQIWHFIFGFADSMALKCAVELHIPDILHSHPQPITLSQIASSLPHDPTNVNSRPDTAYLARIMRLLVRRKIFTAERKPSDGGDGETLYGATRYSKWLVSDSEMSLAPLLLMQNHPWLLAPWHCLSRCVTEGGVAFEKAHGRPIWEFASENPEFNQIFNAAMACTTKIAMKAVVEEYGEAFGSVGSVVDVGGGIGTAVAEIVKAFPKVQGINFDLPHVVATAPPLVGVSHVGGDMFEAIPAADVAFMKYIMHDWNDEDCVKILKNCRKAIPEKTGKVVIVDIVLRPDGNGTFDDMGFIFDLLMIAHVSGGKERTEVEWKNILDQSGFPRYKIINIPALSCIIEAYPNQS